MPEKPVITSNLRKSFESNEVLRGVDLEIPPGAVVGLIGTNGSGKSTLIKCLLGLLKPTSGSTSIFGESAWDMSAQTKSRLCYVPQEVSHYPWMKVRDIIDYTAAFYPNWDAEWTQTLVDRWAIPLDSVGKTLSTGQAQKLALVLGMGHRPDLMIFDEPVASLDPVGRREFLRSILDLTGDAERTLLFSTHITSDLERVASHVAILRDGRIQYFDELDVLKDQFKRLRIHADGDLPESFQIAGSLKTEVRGGTAVAAVPNVSDAMLSSIRSEYGVDVRVEDLNLEEIFVELHHG